MFINKSKDGKNNICGEKVTELRTKLGISQRKLADRLQILGLDVDKNAIQRIEAGKRFVTDIELCYLCKVFEVDYSALLPEI
ncbi:MAG: helix-turn-helix transcriptional regulator [Clostridia bacterium]|nr:helix-turn-helix transcriptional regulator [Clostridia bacterium]